MGMDVHRLYKNTTFFDTRDLIIYHFGMWGSWSQSPVDVKGQVYYGHMGLHTDVGSGSYGHKHCSCKQAQSQ